MKIFVVRLQMSSIEDQLRLVDNFPQTNCTVSGAARHTSLLIQTVYGHNRVLMAESWEIKYQQRNKQIAF